jgi:serine/threonine protein kinase
MSDAKRNEVDTTQKMSLPSEKDLRHSSSHINENSNTNEDSHAASSQSSKKISFFSKKKLADDLVRSTAKPSKLTGVEIVNKDIPENDVKTHYELREKFSEGAQGELRFAYDKALKRCVAVKSLKKDSSSDQAEHDSQLFVSEARIMAQLDHPSIIPLYGLHCGPDKDLHLAMKHISGKTLEQYLRDIVILYNREGINQFNEHRSLGVRIGYFLKVCEAVQYAHSKGVIHRDLKPENIMIGDFGEVYVMDWGLAGLLEDVDESEKQSEVYGTDSGEKEKTHLAGTPSYLAPELIRGEMYSQKSDIFSLGLILFEIVTLKKAVSGNTINDVLNNILSGQYNSFQHHFPKIPLSEDIKAIITKAIFDPPSGRYDSVEQMASDLKLFLMREEVSVRPDNFLRSGVRWMINHKLATALVVMSLLLCSSAVTIFSLVKQNRIIQRAREREMILTHYQNKVNEKGHSMDRLFLHLKGLLAATAQRAGELLSRKTADGASRVYTNSAYKKTETSPPDLTFSQNYRKKVSLDYPVFKIAPGIPMQKVKNTIDKIEPLKSTFQTALYGSIPEIDSKPVSTLKKIVMLNGLPLCWIYVGLQEGFFMSYPGKGGYKPEYDPRKRPWYRAAANKHGICWSKPYLCVSGQGIVIACTKSIFDKNKAFRGVAGMDISFKYILERLFRVKKHRDLNKYLLDQSGKIIISTDYNKAVSESSIKKNCVLSLKDFPLKSIFQKAQKNKGGQFKANIGGKNYILAFAYIPSLKWYYVEQIGEKELFKSN